VTLPQEQTKPELAGMAAEIANGECKRLYEKWLTGLEEPRRRCDWCNRALKRSYRLLVYPDCLKQMTQMVNR
jgi:hypothetical protein